MRCCLAFFIVVSVWVLADARSRSKSRGRTSSQTGKSQFDLSTDSPPTRPGTALQRNAVYATGSVPTDCVPVEYYFVNANNQLMRKNQNVDRPGKVADNVGFAFTAWDDSVWFVDANGKAFRFHYNNEPEEVPDVPRGVKFLTFAPMSFEETYASTGDGDIYRYVANKWFKLDPTGGKKTSVSVGIDGFLLAADRKTTRIWSFDHETQKFKRYDTTGVSADVYDEDHVIVVKDMENNVKVKTGSRWTELREKCRRISAFSVDAFYCTTPEGDVKAVE
ncbi:uncharacterized protein LOC129592781 [Paramacrobiotus metropolitanus]|uniref:uncharacterized protein LOC129592781 n=1 Tax=Paramacrobiotus metropolitanus TaxID=2943436 RepID=UPI002445DDD0|nr:uncharacterized protein LOC129592781 [Paramacrobiotus metropolitanus]